MKTVNTQGTYLRPSGPMLVSSIEVMKPVTPSTATCQRPGTSSRFIPPSMNSQIAAEHDQHPQRAVGEDERVARPDRPTSGSIWNWCIGSILVSAATCLNLRDPPSGPA